MFALFMILAMLAGASIAMLNLKTQGQRLREEQMIWRGEQYKRAIRLYFHKTGHYPQTIDDLQKGLPDLHFLRQAYKDPMNTGDGTWRYIYVNPAGQIIGSVKYANLQQMALLDQPGGPQAAGGPGLGTPASALNQNTSSVTAFSQITGPTNTSGQSTGGTTTGGDSSGQNGQPNPQNPQNPPSPQPGQNPQSGQNPQQGGFGPQPGGGLGLGGGPGQQGSLFGPQGQSGPGGTGNPLTDMKPTGPVDGPVLGAFLTGVVSKVDKNSFKVLKGAKKYKEWEFIWNPLEDQAAAAQQAIGQGAGAPGVALPFANPGIFGNPPPGGTNPGGQQPQPQPQPQQPQGPQSPN